MVPREQTYVLEAVALRNGVDLLSEDDVGVVSNGRDPEKKKVSAAEIQEDFERYYRDAFPFIVAQEQIQDAEAFIGKMESAILANVYGSDEPTVVWSSLHFLCVLSTHVLPICEEEYFPDSEAAIDHGLDFVLEKCELMVGTRIKIDKWRKAVMSTTKLMIDVLRLYTSEAWRRSRKERLAMVTQQCEVACGS
jgi:hypothetical protein